MSALANLIEVHSDEVVRDWAAALRQGPGDGLTPSELIDHLPVVLRDMTKALRGGVPAAHDELAESHGRQRYRLGFSVEVLVHEYALLQRLILDEAGRSGVNVTLNEFRILGDYLAGAIRECVVEYSRQRQSQVTAEQQKLAQFFDLSPDLLAVSSLHTGLWMRINRAMGGALGFVENELLQITVLELIHPDHRVACGEAIVHAAAGHIVDDFISPVLCKNGSYVNVSWQAASIAGQGTLLWAGRPFPAHAGLVRDATF